MMKLDGLDRLSLFDPTSAGNATIVIDPAAAQPSILIGGQRVLTAASAATSYLPLMPLQLAVGVNNTVGADALAIGSSVRATGNNATALGSNTVAAGINSFAAGDHAEAHGVGQFVTGTYNVPQGDSNTSAPTDSLFIVGNGVDDSHRSNAITVLRNGNTGIGTSAPGAKLDVQGDARINGDMTITGAIRIPPQGDLSMGEFTHTPGP
jgi:hypothetical protein